MAAHHLVLKRSRSTHCSPAGHAAAAGQAANPIQAALNQHPAPTRGAGATSSPLCLGTTELSHKIILAEDIFLFQMNLEENPKSDLKAVSSARFTQFHTPPVIQVWMHHATSLFQVNVGIQDYCPNPYLRQKQVMSINRLHFTSASLVIYILLSSRLLKVICLTFAMHNSIKIRFFFKSGLWHSKVLLLFSEQFQNQCIPLNKKTWQASVKCYILLWHRLRDGWGMKSEVPGICKLQLREEMCYDL